MKKLKQHYRNCVKRSHCNYSWEIYPSIRSGTHKSFSTKQEKSFYFIHLIETRGYPIKLRAARGRVLPDPWDDYPSIVSELSRSWKHNSKRCKQYYK
ncbi:hypothetical protein CXF74_02325 [Psychromonas sp. Urea-02u-13]|nr:hypothetical protein CXF74_02325 [Psychromonas sp. Urea-02u-13]